MFTIRPFESRSIEWWYSEIENIDLNPSYQRNSGIWNDEDKSFLINSILNGFDIPKFYIADFTYINSHLNKSGKLYAVIDGKQRLSAIFEFLSGKLKLSNNFVNNYMPDADISNLGFNEIKEKYPDIAKRISSFNISVMSVITDEESLINDLFVRLNRSKPLNGAEIRSGMKGVIPDLIKRITSTDFFSKNISFATKRKQDENIAAKLLLLEHKAGFFDTKRTNLDKFVVESIYSENSNYKRTAEIVISYLDFMSNNFKEKDKLLKSAGIIPVYYWVFRNLKGHIGGNIHQGLLDFNKKRAQSNDDPFGAYNVANRSTDDKNSYEIRYKILVEYLRSNGYID